MLAFCSIEHVLKSGVCSDPVEQNFLGFMRVSAVLFYVLRFFDIGCPKIGKSADRKVFSASAEKTRKIGAYPLFS